MQNIEFLIKHIKKLEKDTKSCKKQTCDNCKYFYQNDYNRYCDALPVSTTIHKRTTPCIYYESKIIGKEDN